MSVCMEERERDGGIRVFPCRLSSLFTFLFFFFSFTFSVATRVDVLSSPFSPSLGCLPNWSIFSLSILNLHFLQLTSWCDFPWRDSFGTVEVYDKNKKKTTRRRKERRREKEPNLTRLHLVYHPWSLSLFSSSFLSLLLSVTQSPLVPACCWCCYLTRTKGKKEKKS